MLVYVAGKVQHLTLLNIAQQGGKIQSKLKDQIAHAANKVTQRSLINHAEPYNYFSCTVDAYTDETRARLPACLHDRQNRMMEASKGRWIRTCSHMIRIY